MPEITTAGYLFLLGMTMCSVMLSLILCFRFFAMPKKVRWKAEEELIRMLLAIHARHQPQQIFKPQMQPTITTYAPATIQSPFQPTTGTIGTGVPMIIGETQNPMAQQPQVKIYRNSSITTTTITNNEITINVSNGNNTTSCDTRRNNLLSSLIKKNDKKIHFFNTVYQVLLPC
ncbi:hypothetical protein DERF_001974 [Dermatophagoides farinae]|uniref:Uncharacterized protein n=1 Tax=Dermatophagoides farinae TaxID=6954 RepID=A0A922LBL5_DERFA|nr:hypothetical protein DERF_001974 [Dermatophagoides farinae]